MNIRAKHYLVGLAALTFTVPVWAHTYKEPLAVDKDTTIGSAKLNRGSYELSADDATKDMNIMLKGKVIATVQGQWVKMAQKAEAPSVVTEGDKITQVQFSGSNQAFQVQ